MSVTLCAALSKIDDIELHVVTVDRSVSTVQISKTERATIHRLPFLGGSVLRNAVGVGRRQLQQYLHQVGPDVVHAHDTYGLMTVGLQLPRLFTIHGFIYGDTLVSGTRFAHIRSWLWKHFETKGWANQPAIISISPYVRERLAGIARGSIYDIDNPVAEPFFSICRRSSPVPIVFSAALIEPRKNQLGLIETFADVLSSGVDAELHLAGRISNEQYGSDVRAAIERLGIGSRVRLLGSISSTQVMNELAAASVFALVSLEENSPIGIEEAMAAGVPVLTSNRCGMPYMVRHGYSGLLVDPLSRRDIAAKLTRMLTDQSAREMMGRNARAVALDRFHPDAVARRTLEAYHEQLGPGRFERKTSAQARAVTG